MPVPYLSSTTGLGLVSCSYILLPSSPPNPHYELQYSLDSESPGKYFVLHVISMSYRFLINTRSIAGKKNHRQTHIPKSKHMTRHCSRTLSFSTMRRQRASNYSLTCFLWQTSPASRSHMRSIVRQVCVWSIS